MHHDMIMKILKLEDKHLDVMNVHLDIEYTQGHHTCPFYEQRKSKVHDYRIRSYIRKKSGRHLILCKLKCCSSHHLVTVGFY
jgi:hypothetical protein